MFSSTSEKTVFQAATVKAIPILVVTGCSAYLSVAAEVTAIKLIGVFATFIGAYCFLAILITAVTARNALEFNRNVNKVMITLSAQAFVEICVQVATRVLHNILDNAFSRNR